MKFFEFEQLNRDLNLGEETKDFKFEKDPKQILIDLEEKITSFQANFKKIKEDNSEPKNYLEIIKYLKEELEQLNYYYFFLNKMFLNEKESISTSINMPLDTLLNLNEEFKKLHESQFNFFIKRRIKFKLNNISKIYKKILFGIKKNLALDLNLQNFQIVKKLSPITTYYEDKTTLDSALKKEFEKLDTITNDLKKENILKILEMFSQILKLNEIRVRNSNYLLILIILKQKEILKVVEDTKEELNNTFENLKKESYKSKAIEKIKNEVEEILLELNPYLQFNIDNKNKTLNLEFKLIKNIFPEGINRFLEKFSRVILVTTTLILFPNEINEIEMEKEPITQNEIKQDTIKETINFELKEVLVDKEKYEKLISLINERKITKDELKNLLFSNQYKISIFFYSDSFVNSIPRLVKNRSRFFKDNTILKDFYLNLENSIFLRKYLEEYFTLVKLYIQIFNEKNIQINNYSSLFNQNVEFTLPKPNILNLNHEDAIDIYYQKSNPDSKLPINAIKGGLVLLSMDKWTGNEDLNSYLGGGLGPKSGNVVVIFNPNDNYLYAYFHLSETLVKAGEIISSGENIGIGGRTGINAKRFKIDEHLHFEIHKISGNSIKSLLADELYEILNRILFNR